MGSKEQHLSMHTKNKNLANTSEISKTENYDWKVIMIYYAAVHLLDSTYSEDDINPHPTTHTKRKTKIKEKHNRNIFNCYKNLEDLSRLARYDCITIKEKHVRKATQYLSFLESSIS